jgi:hypothetical protein
LLNQTDTTHYKYTIILNQQKSGTVYKKYLKKTEFWRITQIPHLKKSTRPSSLTTKLWRFYENTLKKTEFCPIGQIPHIKKSTGLFYQTTKFWRIL